MSTLREAAQQALEAMESAEVDPHSSDAVYKAIANLRAALAEPVQEPVAWIHTDPDKPRVKFLEWREDDPGYRGRWIKTPLYPAPPQRRPLTDEDVGKIILETEITLKNYCDVDLQTDFARRIERAHGIGEKE